MMKRKTLPTLLLILAAFSTSACSVLMGPKRYSQNSSWVAPVGGGTLGPGYDGGFVYNGHTTAQSREAVSSYDHRTNQQMNANR